MDYIFKQQLLNIDQKKNANVQYYQWAEKKRAQKQKAEYQQFKKMWHLIQEQEQKSNQHQKKNDKKPKLIQQKPTSIQPEITYVKNMIWRQQVQTKIDKIRQQQFDELQKEEMKVQEQCVYKQKKMFRDPEHKGPIKAWEQRFENYVKAKSGQSVIAEQNYFQPAINKNSRRIANNFAGRVENRLIQYGQKLKQKKAQMEAAYDQQLYDRRNKQSQEQDNDISDIFWRLYKDGELINKKKNEKTSQYTFTPQINQHSVELVSRISQKRKPLYQSKLIQQKPINKKDQLTDREKISRQKGFNDFLKRNQAHLHKINNHRIQKIQFTKEKQNRQNKECTFAPTINPNSRKISFKKPTQLCQINIQTIKNNKINIDDGVKEKKILNVKSSLMQSINTVNNNAKSASQFERLNSQGNYPFNNKDLYISENESLSNINAFQNSKIINFDQIIDIRKQMNSSFEDQPLFTTGRNNEKTGVITEQFQEDSIQKQKEVIWQNQLQMMERQIEQMMKRTSN